MGEQKNKLTSGFGFVLDIILAFCKSLVKRATVKSLSNKEVAIYSPRL